jgi:hypothetical protein
MPPVLDPAIERFPHFSARGVNREMTAFLRRPEHDYVNRRLRAELDLYNSIESQTHSLDYQIFELEEHRTTLYTEQSRVGLITRSNPSSDDESLETASLFKKPSDQVVLIEKVGPNRAEQERVEAELESVIADLKRLREKRAELTTRARPLSARLETMRKFIRSAMTSGRPLRTVPLPSINKAPPLDKLHSTVATFRAQLAAIEAAPFPPDVAKARVKAWVEKMSRPPYAISNALDREGVITLGDVHMGGTFQPDVCGLVFWIAKDQIVAKLGEMIDAAAGDDGLDDATRATRLRDTAAKIDTSERLIEAIIWARLSAGEPVDPVTDLSPDASAPAILSLSQDK